MCTSTIDNHSNGANRLQLSNCIAKSISTQPNRTQLDWERDWHRQSHPELIVRICISRSRLYQAVCPFCVSLAFAIYFLHNLCTHSDNTPDKQWKPWWVWATTDNDRTMLTCVDGHRYYKKLHSNQLLIRKGDSRSVRAGSKKLALQFTTHFSATTLFTTLVVIVPNKDRNLPTPLSDKSIFIIFWYFTPFHCVVLWILYDANLSLRVHRLPQRSSDIGRKMPNGGLFFSPWRGKVEGRQPVVKRSFRLIHAQDDTELWMCFQESAYSTWKDRTRFFKAIWQIVVSWTHVRQFELRYPAGSAFATMRTLYKLRQTESQDRLLSSTRSWNGHRGIISFKTHGSVDCRWADEF